jgi:NADPH:quinone reductase
MLMKAVQYSKFGSAEVLQVVELPEPEPADGQVLLQVIAVGVSFVDVRQRQGAYNKAETRVGGIQLPAVPGLQVVGKVVAVGRGVESSLVGRKVVAIVGRGSYAQRCLAAAELCVVAPEETDDALLAVLPMQGLTAYFMLTQSTVLRRGESVLVHAAGSGVGALAVQIAKIMGAGRVIATARTEEKRAFARSVGADIALDYSAPDWTRTVLEETAGRGVDVLLESIGGEVFEQNFECLAMFGRYVIFGSTQGIGKPVEARRLMTKCQSLTGIYVPVFTSRPGLVREGLAFLVEQARQGNLRLPIAAELPLSDAGKAQQMLEDRQVTGAIVLRPEV